MVKSKMKVIDLNPKETPFGPAVYDTLELGTSVTLLASPEDAVVLRALSTLSKYVDIDDSNVETLYKTGVLKQLPPLLYRTNETIIKFTLKILARLFMLEEVYQEMIQEDKYSTMQHIATLFADKPDEVIKEFGARILSFLSKDALIASLIYDLGVIKPMFLLLKHTNDPDCQKNTLELLYYLINTKEAQCNICTYKEFNLGIILCFLKSQYDRIRELVMDIFVKLVYWKNEQIQVEINEGKILEKMYSLILDDANKNLHQRAFEIIQVSMSCPITTNHFLETLEFLLFCDWIKTCQKTYMQPASNIILMLTQNLEITQILFDFAFEDSILYLFRTNNEKVLLNACKSINNMSTLKKCCDKILTPVLIRSLIEILNRTDISLIPYKEEALNTIYNFMKRNVKTMKMLVDYGGLQPILNYYNLEQEQMTYDGYHRLMDIMHLYATNTKYKLKIMIRSCYEQTLNIFQSDNENICQKALNILEQFIDNYEHRQYFIDYNGPNTVGNKMLQVFHENLFKHILFFIQRITIYKEAALAFLYSELLPKLQSINVEIQGEMPLIHAIIDTMYDLYLPLKFDKKGQLEVTDKITERFCLTKGQWVNDCPFIEILESECVSTRNTIYIVDFSAPKGLAQKTLQRPNNATVGDGEFDEITVQVEPPINYGGITPDTYLPEYLERLESIIACDDKRIQYFHHRVTIVAKFVALLLSGVRFNLNPCARNRAFNCHITSLKFKLGTNMIPLGYLRDGYHCERALLFKALCDQIGIPATLTKNQNNTEVYWNEVPIIPEAELKSKYVKYYVVDLMENVGKLLEVGSLEAMKYTGTLIK